MSNVKDNELSELFEKQLCFHNDSKSEDILRSEIPTTFSSFECPFTWKYDFICVQDTTIRIEDKLLEINSDDPLTAWKSFVLNLILCYEYAKAGDLQDAVEKQTLCDNILDDNSISEDSSTLLNMGIGLRHISLACKCFLMYASNERDEAEKISKAIVPFDNLETRDKASVFCAKGAFCSEYGYRGIQESIGFIQKAIDIDERAEWFFLLGRSLARIRRLDKRAALPDKRELRALESAVQLSDNPSFRALLAQSYRETACNVFHEKRRDLNTFKPYIDSLNQKALESYRIVLKKGKNDVHICIRCALGLMKLPHPWKDLDEAKTCILKALELAPQNPMANHVAGTYYRTVNNYKEAMHYFSKAAASGVFGAEMDLITLKRKQNGSYNPLADLERLLHTYKEKPHVESILCHLGAYYYKTENDFKKALKYWLKVIEEDINSYRLRVHFDSISVLHGSYNINKIVLTEIMKILEKGNHTESERQLYDQIITKLIMNHPGLVATNTDIDVSKYKDSKFEYNSWKAQVFGKTFPYSNRNKYGNGNVSNNKSQFVGKIQDEKSSIKNSELGCSKPLVLSSTIPVPDITDMRKDESSSTRVELAGSREMARRVASSTSQNDRQASAGTSNDRGNRLDEYTSVDNHKTYDTTGIPPSRNKGISRGRNMKNALSTSGVPHSSKSFDVFDNGRHVGKDDGQQGKEGNNIPVRSTPAPHRGRGRGRGRGGGQARGNFRGKHRGDFYEKVEKTKTEKKDH